MKVARARVGLALEVIAWVVAVAIAFALSLDERATATHRVSLWTAAIVAFVPPLLSIVGTRGALTIDGAAAASIVVCTFGCYQIGGLALLFPACVLGLAAMWHWLITPAGASRRRTIAIISIGVGSLLTLFSLLTYAGVAIAPIGLGLVMWGAYVRGE